MPDSIVLFSLVQNILANDSFRNCTLTNKGGVPFDQQNLSEILEKERLIECSVGFVIIGCMLANEKALSLSSKDVRVLLRWLIKFGGEKIGICNSYSSDILLWKLKNSFSNLLSIEQRKEMSLKCDSPEDMYLLNMSVGFLNQVKGNIRYGVSEYVSIPFIFSFSKIDQQIFVLILMVVRSIFSFACPLN